jgi:cytidyltransferase-like protein
VSGPAKVLVSGGFDDIRSHDIRFIEEAARLGKVTVHLHSDAAISAATGRAPKFPLAERRYLLQALRFVSEIVVGDAAPDEWPAGIEADVWACREAEASAEREAICRRRGIAYCPLSEADLRGFPQYASSSSGRKKVLITGCFDWFHSGHVRFCEEAASHGDLYVVVGHDANIRLLKGEGHPLLPQEERRYMVGALRTVRQALISSGSGWRDAEPEIRHLKPDIYVVNEDGDKGGKDEFCRQLGIEYRVLKRRPADGLPRRSSTDLRGF